MPAPYREHEVRALRSASPAGRARPAEADAAARRALVRFHTRYPWARAGHVGLTGLTAAVSVLLLVVLRNDRRGLLALACAAIVLPLGSVTLAVWQYRRTKALFAEALADPSPVCPACGYDLRGLSGREPDGPRDVRCPECGGDVPAAAR